MPGCAPGGAVPFLLRPVTGRKKGTKKGGPHWPRPCASLRATCGTHARGGAPEIALFASLSPLKHPERASSRSKGILRCPCPPLALRSSARPEGQGDTTRAIASLGLAPCTVALVLVLMHLSASPTSEQEFADPICYCCDQGTGRDGQDPGPDDVACHTPAHSTCALSGAYSDDRAGDGMGG